MRVCRWPAVPGRRRDVLWACAADIQPAGRGEHGCHERSTQYRQPAPVAGAIRCVLYRAEVLVCTADHIPAGIRVLFLENIATGA